jgi:hypothetical protein
MAPAVQPGPEAVGSALVAGQAGVVGEHMLVEAQLAARSDHAMQLGQRGCLVGDRAQHQGGHAGVHGAARERDRFCGAVDDGHRYGSLAGRLDRQAPQVGLGFDGDDLGDGVWVVGEVEPAAGADLDDSAREAGEEPLTMLCVPSRVDRTGHARIGVGEHRVRSP